MKAELVAALGELTQAASGKGRLSDQRIDELSATIEKHEYIFGKSEPIMRAAVDFTAAFDASQDSLFKTNRQEWGKGAKRSGLRWADFLTMQSLLDHAYTPENLAKYPDLLGSAHFATAAYFPGPCPRPEKSDPTYSVNIWASFPDTPPQNFWMWHNPARKPTGAYVAPGTIVTVTVPQLMVNKGFQIRIGAHANDLVRRPRITRLWRTTLLHPITSTEVKVANPFGGGVYIEVPPGADEGEAQLSFKNIVRSPFYSNTQVRQTSLPQWRNVERRFPAPWADFQSEAFMMQLPRVWVYNLEDPVALMAKWDAAVTAVVKLIGFDIDDIGREAFYIQPDTQLRNSVFSPGHPQVNVGGVEPGADRFNGLNAEAFQLRGPRYAPDWIFHEWGHYLALSGPAGEAESSNNFLHAVALNWGLNVDMDEAFGTSRGSRDPFRTLDNTAVVWMTGLNFADGEMATAQKQYQLKGHAKFADIARLFGWQTLRELYQSINRDDIAFWKSKGKQGEEWPKNIENAGYIERLSLTSGVDMRPLFHFWGVPPEYARLLLSDPARLEAAERHTRTVFDEAKTAAEKAPKDKTAVAELEQAKSRLDQAGKNLEQYSSGIEKARKDATEFNTLIESGKINRSAKIYDELLKFKSLVPDDNAAFRKFALAWYKWKAEKPPTTHLYWTENDHRQQWDAYNKESAANIRAAIDRLIAFYFPSGRPVE